jgi:hypothetical protein
MDSRNLALARIPITVYKEDPNQSETLSEWHEVWLATDAAEQWFLCENHGWWDEAAKKAHFAVPILSEPYKNEEEANAGFDARINTLDREGWIHKMTCVLDYRNGRIIPIKLP